MRTHAHTYTHTHTHTHRRVLSPELRNQEQASPSIKPGACIFIRILFARFHKHTDPKKRLVACTRWRHIFVYLFICMHINMHALFLLKLFRIVLNFWLRTSHRGSPPRGIAIVLLQEIPSAWAQGIFMYLYESKQSNTGDSRNAKMWLRDPHRWTVYTSHATSAPSTAVPWAFLWHCIHLYMFVAFILDHPSLSPFSAYAQPTRTQREGYQHRLTLFPPAIRQTHRHIHVRL